MRAKLDYWLEPIGALIMALMFFAIPVVIVHILGRQWQDLSRGAYYLFYCFPVLFIFLAAVGVKFWRRRRRYLTLSFVINSMIESAFLSAFVAALASAGMALFCLVTSCSS